MEGPGARQAAPTAPDHRGSPRRRRSIGKQPKYRPSPSCTPCRKRKVKCDRSKPCQACRIRGVPEECEYSTNSEDRFYISQAEAIDNLRSEVDRLKRQLAGIESATPSDIDPDRGSQPGNTPVASQRPVVQDVVRNSSAPPGGKYSAFEAVYSLIASAPPDLVYNAISQIRNGTPVEAIAARTARLSHSGGTNETRGPAGIEMTPVDRDRILGSVSTLISDMGVGTNIRTEDPVDRRKERKRT